MRKPGLTVKGKLKKLLGVDSLPVNPSVFPPALLKAAEAKAAFVAIYIIAPRNQKWPISFGLTTDPVATYFSFQKGWWEEHCLHVLLWTPGRPAAERVKRGMTDLMSSQRKFFSRSWYDATVEEAERALRVTASKERVQLFDDVDKQKRIYQAAQKAWEQKMGVQVERVPAVVASNVVPMLPGRTRQNAEKV